MWSAEGVANQFVGPPLGSLLLAVAFSLPFFVDAASFFVAAALVFLIPGTFRPDGHETPRTKPWRVELAEGFRWLWGHTLLRPMAIILGLMNGGDDDLHRRRSCCSPRRCSTSDRCCSA